MTLAKPATTFVSFPKSIFLVAGIILLSVSKALMVVSWFLLLYAKAAILLFLLILSRLGYL